MAAHTQLKQSDIREIAGHYGLLVAESEPINGGNGNSSFLLTTPQGKYVLTVCDDKTLDEVVIMGRLLLLLKECNFPCTRVVPAVNRDIITMYVNKPVMLKVYIEGQVVESLNQGMLSQVGMATARLNQIPSPDYLPDEHPYGIQLFSRVFGLNIDEKYESWLAKQFDVLEQNIPLNLPRGLIHGDLFYDNLLFEQGKLNAIIDFEETCHYYKVFDLGMAIIGSCVDGSAVNLDKARALVNGYQQVKPLEKIEKETLQMFVQYAATATSYWRFDKYNIDTPNADKADHHWQMVHLAEQIKCIPTTEFYDRIFN